MLYAIYRAVGPANDQQQLQRKHDHRTTMSEMEISGMGISGTALQAEEVEDESPAIDEREVLRERAPPPSNNNKPGSADAEPKAKGMTRAKAWSWEVEEAYRFQCAGWKSLEEYVPAYGEPERHPESNLVCKLQLKSNGFFMYFRNHRECADKYLGRIKIYTY